jgi:hypothetical protein
MTNNRFGISYGIKRGKSGVDRKYKDDQSHGLIKGVAVMTKGKVKDDRAWTIDDTTLDQIVLAGNSQSSAGVKSRFGHPPLFADGIGTFLGRMKDFYRDGDVARADLYINKAAHDAPKGDLANYVMDLAESDPESFGTSAVLGEFSLEEKGKGLPPVLRIKSLVGVDVVDDPAANDGMFSILSESDPEMSEVFNKVLDKIVKNPEALEYVMNFLKRYRKYQAELKADSLFEELTADQIRKERPDLVTTLQSESVNAGAKAERSRVLEIYRYARNNLSAIGLDPIAPLLLKVIGEGATLDTFINEVHAVIKELNSDKKNPEDVKKLPHLDRARIYQRTHGCGLIDALRATADPRS